MFKPAVTGLDESGPRRARPRAASPRGGHRDQSDDEIAPYRFGPPVSPHLAAEMAGERDRPRRPCSPPRGPPAEGADLLVCEGVGGFLVPLTAGYLVRDLARELALPVVIAASPGLGTINHTLLTLESVRAAGLESAAVVLTPWPGGPSAMEESNRETIEALGEVRSRLCGTWT